MYVIYMKTSFISLFPFMKISKKHSGNSGGVLGLELKESSSKALLRADHLSTGVWRSYNFCLGAQDP